MTNSTQTSPPAQSHPELSANDPRALFAAAVRTASEVMGGVTAGQLRLPTPCSEWDVENLSRHLVAVMHRVTVIGRGGDWSTTPLLATGIDASALAQSFTEAAHDLQSVFTDPSILERPLVLPFATLPGAAALAIYTAEISVHAWDLASATDQVPEWDEAATTVGLKAVRMGLPAEGRGPELPFDEVAATAPDAPTIHQLVAWMGRKPS